MELNARFMTRANAVLFTATLIGEVILVIGLTRPIWIKQPLFERITSHKDLISDISPPPLLLRGLRGELARTLLTAERIKNPAKIARDPSVSQLDKNYKKTRHLYEEQQKFWTSNQDIEPALRNSISDKTTVAASHDLAPIGNRLIPALQSGNLAQADQIDRDVDRDYQPHLSDIDAITDSAIAAINAQEEAAVASQSRSIILVIISTLGLLALAYYVLFIMQKASIVLLGQIAGELSEGSDQFMGATNDVASATMGNASMEAMSRAMGAIEQSSNEVAKIVKSIDEIAFQTNILPLNAAVEAARAGEAGAGFAVVAEEVRSLARRSAAATHESSDNIKAPILSSREGATCLKDVGASFAKIGERVQHTDHLVSEITMAAKDQAQGIEHITMAIQEVSEVAQNSGIAIEQMRKSAEQSASNSQQIAGATEQMRCQASEQRQITAQLRPVVDGSPVKESLDQPHPAKEAVERGLAASAMGESQRAGTHVDAQFREF